MDEAKQKNRLTSLERAWILYDVGNSAQICFCFHFVFSFHAFL